MWYQVFLWNLFSSIFCHFVASAIAFARLRKHKIGRFIPAIVLVMGFLSPLTGGVVTSKCVTVTSRNFQKAVRIGRLFSCEDWAPLTISNCIHRLA